MFVDTSVIVAILAAEDDAPTWASRLESVSTKQTSPLVVLEATMRLSTMLAADPCAVERVIRSFLGRAGIEIVSIDDAMTTIAVDAFARYGKGRGHPARLNLADCLSYACAKMAGVGLLYKGNDFALTDLG